MKANQGIMMLFEATGVNASNKKITGKEFGQRTKKYLNEIKFVMYKQR